MKKDKFIKVFIVLQLLMFLIFLYDNVIGMLSLGVILFFELFYIMIMYKSKDSAILKTVSFVSVLSFFLYSYLTKDPSNLVILVYMFFTQIFLFSFYKENKIFKRGAIDFIKYSYFLMCMLFVILGYYREIAYFLFVFYPILFIDYNKSKFDIVMISISSLIVLIKGDTLLIAGLAFYLSVLTIYYAFSKSKRNLKVSLPFLIVSLLSLLSIRFEFTSVNSSVFYEESLIIKFIKAFIALFPLMYYVVYNYRLLSNNKYYLSNDMKILLLIIVGYFVLILYTRLDIPAGVIVAASYVFVIFYRLQKDKIKSIDNNKVTILALHLGYGGIEKYLSSLCHMIDNYDIDIISTYRVLDKPVFDYGKANISYLMDIKPNKNEFKRALNSKNPISIIKEGVKSLVILYKKKALNVEAIQNINSKYIITTRDFHNELVGSYADKRIIKIATEHNYHNDDEDYIEKVVNSVYNTNYFVLVSENLKDFYKSKTKAKCVYIPNCIDEIPSKSTCKDNNLVSVGRLSKEKAQEDLIDVLKLIAKEYKDIKLYLVGDGEEKENLVQKVKKEGLDKNVVFTGFLNRKELDKVMHDSRIFVTTSLTESFGLAEIEAQSYNIPVVAFDSADGLVTLLKDDAGVLIKKRSKKEMANAIMKLLEDDKYYKSIANKGLENAKKYDIKNVKKMWNDLLK